MNNNNNNNNHNGQQRCVHDGEELPETTPGQHLRTQGRCRRADQGEKREKKKIALIIKILASKRNGGRGAPAAGRPG
jgi:hypothetical protein